MELNLSPQAIRAAAEAAGDQNPDYRLHCLAYFNDTPWPQPGTPDWMFTDISNLSLIGMELLNKPITYQLNDTTKQYIDHNSMHPALVVQNGAADYLEADHQLATLPLADYLLTDRQLQSPQNKWEALHKAVNPGGLHIGVQENVTIDQPVDILHVHSGDGLLFQRINITLEKNAVLTIIDRSVSLNNAIGNIHTLIDVNLAPGAHCNYVLIQNNAPNTRHFIDIRSDIPNDATFNPTVIAAGSSFCRLDMKLRCIGRNARCTGRSLALVYPNYHCDVHPIQHYTVSDTTGSYYHKSVVYHAGRSIFTGRVHIPEHVKNIEAYQNNHNLVLSSKAEIDTIPQLEISSNDVRCSHGATVSRVDHEELFYCMARGINQAASERLIVQGFIAELLHDIPAYERIINELALPGSNNIRQDI